MSMDGSRRASSAGANHVSKKLCFTIVMFVGVICLCGGYVLGNVARNEARKINDIISHNLTTASEILYKKAKRLSPKAVNHHDPEKIAARLLETFRSDCIDCKMKNLNVDIFAKTLVHHEVVKLIRSIHNASVYLDSVR